MLTYRDFHADLLPGHQGFDLHFNAPTSNEWSETVLLHNGPFISPCSTSPQRSIGFRSVWVHGIVVPAEAAAARPSHRRRDMEAFRAWSLQRGKDAFRFE
jgi:hypothetical protein